MKFQAIEHTDPFLDCNRVAIPLLSQSGSCELINNYFNIIDSLPLTVPL